MDQQLQVMEQNGERVLTTAQLAESFGTDNKHISDNFTNNKARYEAGKHYFELRGDALRAFKEGYPKLSDNLKFAPVLYLWTEKGAWMHAKSLNTDQAWTAHEALVDDYYRVKAQAAAIAPKDEMTLLLESALDARRRLDTMETRLDTLESKTTLNNAEASRLQRAVRKRVCAIVGGSDRSAFAELYREIYDRWGVASYRDVPHVELDNVLAYVAAWVPRKSAAA